MKIFKVGDIDISNSVSFDKLNSGDLFFVKAHIEGDCKEHLYMKLNNNSTKNCIKINTSIEQEDIYNMFENTPIDISTYIPTIPVDVVINIVNKKV